MKYICKQCNYQTDMSSNWCSHKKSKKHEKLTKLNDLNTNIILNDNKIDYNLLLEKFKNAENEKNLIISNHEAITILHNNTVNNLQKENKELHDENNKLKNEITKLQQENKKMLLNLNMKLEENNKKIEKDKKKIELEKEKIEQENKKILLNNNIKLEQEYKNEREYNKQIVANAGTLMGKSITTIQYLTKNYNSAPKLCQLEDYSDISSSEQELIDNLIYHYNKSTIHEYIGKYIVRNYKKDNPEQQSIWNTDCDRLNYIIRELMTTNKNTLIIEELDDKDNENLVWTIDKKGNKVSQQIIVPLLEYIKNICSHYINSTNHNKISQMESEKIYKKKETLAMITIDINKGIILKDIQKYISPHFYLNKTTLSIK